jgi:hypothetical protein
MPKINEEFEGTFEKTSNYSHQSGRKGVDVYLNATRDEINEILNEDHYGVRIGVVSIGEIYYWIDSVYHSDMQAMLHKNFILRLTYDAHKKVIHDYEAEDGGYAYKDEYASTAPMDVLKEIKYKLDEIFDYPTYASYMDLEEPTVKTVRSLLSPQFQENGRLRFKKYYFSEAREGTMVHAKELEYWMKKEKIKQEMRDKFSEACPIIYSKTKGIVTLAAITKISNHEEFHPIAKEFVDKVIKEITDNKNKVLLSQFVRYVIYLGKPVEKIGFCVDFIWKNIRAFTDSIDSSLKNTKEKPNTADFILILEGDHNRLKKNIGLLTADTYKEMVNVENGIITLTSKSGGIVKWVQVSYKKEAKKARLGDMPKKSVGFSNVFKMGKKPKEKLGEGFIDVVKDAATKVKEGFTKVLKNITDFFKSISDKVKNALSKSVAVVNKSEPVNVINDILNEVNKAPMAEGRTKKNKLVPYKKGQLFATSLDKFFKLYSEAEHVKMFNEVNRKIEAINSKFNRKIIFTNMHKDYVFDWTEKINRFKEELEKIIKETPVDQIPLIPSQIIDPIGRFSGVFNGLQLLNLLIDDIFKNLENFPNINNLVEYLIKTYRQIKTTSLFGNTKLPLWLLKGGIDVEPEFLGTPDTYLTKGSGELDKINNLEDVPLMLISFYKSTPKEEHLEGRYIIYMWVIDNITDDGTVNYRKGEMINVTSADLCSFAAAYLDETRDYDWMKKTYRIGK